jgi:hypothetical protein
MDRHELIERLKTYNSVGVPEVGHALDILSKSQESCVSNEDIGDIWERISKAIDHKYSNDEEHDAWKLEAELAAAYRR